MKKGIEHDIEFTIRFFEAMDAHGNHDVRILETLAQLYTKAGRIDEGLAIDLRLRDAKPEDPLVHYNLACSLSLIGRYDEAMKSLHKALDLGYRDINWLMRDEDLKVIRALDGFESILARLQGKSGG